MAKNTKVQIANLLDVMQNLETSVKEKMESSAPGIVVIVVGPLWLAANAVHALR